MGDEVDQEEIHIIEHKRRQRKLCQTVKGYERIQWLGYMHLLRHYHRDAKIRCFLFETFQQDTWKCEIEDDPDWFQVSILDVVRRRTRELIELIQSRASH